MNKSKDVANLLGTVKRKQRVLERMMKGKDLSLSLSRGMLK
jgi:hypothetical protein